MATNISGFPRGYSLTPGGLQNIPPFVINTNRAPATSDRANLGTLWNYINNNSVWMLTSATNGNYNWTPLTNNIGVISRLQAANGTIALPVAGLVAFPDTVITGNTNAVTNILTSVQPNNSNNFLINLTPEINLRSALNDVITMGSVTNNDDPANILIFKAKGTIAAPLPVVATTELSDITSYGYDGTANIAGTSILARVPAGGVVGANCVESELVFSTSGSTAGVPPSILNERVVISKDGLVTINAPTAPSSALIVNGVNTNVNFSTIIQATVTGIHEGLVINNLNGAAGSSVRVAMGCVTQAAGTGGDATFTFANYGGPTANYSIGMDNSAEQFVLCKSANLGTANIMTVTNSNNQINYPQQCAVGAYLQPGLANQTGNSGAPNVLFNVVTQDNTLSYNPANGRFTAPQTGRYLIGSNVTVDNITAAMTDGVLQFTRSTSAGVVISQYAFNYCNAAATRNPANRLSFQGHTIIDMNATDYVTVQCILFGGAGNTAGYSGFGARETSFYVQLLS